jgi:MerR family transcriptional regulator, copper efflux regulator
MIEDILTQSELAEKSGVDVIELELWTKAKILKPVGYAEDKTAFFSAPDLDRVLRIRKLRELGYGLEEIQKIIKKYGLPRTEGAEKKPDGAEKFLTVGQLAERTGLSARTIKHWEEMGIIDPDLRSGGGFRLYDESYVYLCKLIRDLQLFGYSLEEVKAVSDSVRDYAALRKDLAAFPAAEAGRKLEDLIKAVEALQAKMRLLREGLERWEDLLKKKKKEIVGLKAKNAKRPADAPGAPDA